MPGTGERETDVTLGKEDVSFVEQKDATPLVCQPEVVFHVSLHVLWQVPDIACY